MKTGKRCENRRGRETKEGREGKWRGRTGNKLPVLFSYFLTSQKATFTNVTHFHFRRTHLRRFCYNRLSIPRHRKQFSEEASVHVFQLFMIHKLLFPLYYLPHTLQTALEGCRIFLQASSFFVAY